VGDVPNHQLFTTNLWVQIHAFVYISDQIAHPWFK